jgi:hypothetical protein
LRGSIEAPVLATVAAASYYRVLHKAQIIEGILDHVALAAITEL